MMLGGVIVFFKNSSNDLLTGLLCPYQEIRSLSLQGPCIKVRASYF